MERKERGNHYTRIWVYLVIFLFFISLAGGAIFLLRHGGGSEPLEISLPETPVSVVEVYVDGAVASEGIYSLEWGSTLREAVQRAGGIREEANSGRLELRVPYLEETPQPQKININTAESWLLEALPGIGEGRAQSIIRYRTESGPFRTISDLTRVPGIGEVTFQQVKDLITVVD
jgi:competence protein ComEA